MLSMPQPYECNVSLGDFKEFRCSPMQTRRQLDISGWFLAGKTQGRAQNVGNPDLTYNPPKNPFLRDGGLA